MKILVQTNFCDHEAVQNHLEQGVNSLKQQGEEMEIAEDNLKENWISFEIDETKTFSKSFILSLISMGCILSKDDRN